MSMRVTFGRLLSGWVGYWESRCKSLRARSCGSADRDHCKREVLRPGDDGTRAYGSDEDAAVCQLRARYLRQLHRSLGWVSTPVRARYREEHFYIATRAVASGSLRQSPICSRVLRLALIHSERAVHGVRVPLRAFLGRGHRIAQPRRPRYFRQARHAVLM